MKKRGSATPAYSRARLVKTVANSIAGKPVAKAGGKPGSGWLTGPRRRDFDPFNGDMTAERVVTLLRMAARGQPEQMDALFDEMLARDDTLRNARRTRRIAVTGLQWEIVPATQQNKSGTDQTQRAEMIADFCRTVLDNLRGLRDAFKHLADAHGRGSAVCEIEYAVQDGKSIPVSIGCVSFRQLRTDTVDPWRLRIVQDGDTQGLPLDEQPPGKFIVHTPESLAGSFFSGLLTVSTVGYLLKRTSKGGMAFGIETYGLPMTIAKYGPTATETDKAEALRMIDELALSRGGVFPESIVVELKESIKTGRWPHHDVNEMVDKGYALAWLGQTGTTSMDASGGSKAAAVVHNEVREDIRDDDIESEAETIREQFLRPLVIQNFGVDAAPLTPHFRRVVEEARDTKVDADVIDAAVNRLGLSVPIRHAVDMLGVPVTNDTNLDDPIPGAPAAPNPFGASSQFPVSGSPVSTSVANAQLDRRMKAGIARLKQIVGGMR